MRRATILSSLRRAPSNHFPWLQPNSIIPLKAPFPASLGWLDKDPVVPFYRLFSFPAVGSWPLRTAERQWHRLPRSTYKCLPPKHVTKSPKHRSKLFPDLSCPRQRSTSHTLPLAAESTKATSPGDQDPFPSYPGALPSAMNFLSLPRPNTGVVQRSLASHHSQQQSSRFLKCTVIPHLLTKKCLTKSPTPETSL